MRARLWLIAVAAICVAFVVAAANSWSVQQLGDHPPRSSDGLLGTAPPRHVRPRPLAAVSPTSVASSSSPMTTRSTPPGPSVLPSTVSLSSPPPTVSGTPSTSTPWRPAPVFGDRLLVAYYGTAGTGSLGVLGSGSIPDVTARLRAVAARFAAASGRPVQIVYELIATVADGFAGPDGNYSHDIPRADVQRYLAAARRNHALLVLDLQPGRSDFLTVARRYAWALRQPDVGLALDPEWRMSPGEVPGEVFGSVSAAEINRTSAYVAGIARQYRLPEKLFLIHQFVPSMVRDISKIRARRGLALVQHVDGYGGRADKLATLRNVAKPREFTLGFKLFYREDVDMFTPAQVLRAVPEARFFSYQ